MKKSIMVLGLSLAFSGVALAKPTFVKKAKCVACHTQAVGKKTNVSTQSLDMKKKYPNQQTISPQPPPFLRALPADIRKQATVSTRAQWIRTAMP